MSIIMHINLPLKLGFTKIYINKNFLLQIKVEVEYYYGVTIKIISHFITSLIISCGVTLPEPCTCPSPPCLASPGSPPELPPGWPASPPSETPVANGHTKSRG